MNVVCLEWLATASAPANELEEGYEIQSTLICYYIPKRVLSVRYVGLYFSFICAALFHWFAQAFSLSADRISIVNAQDEEEEEEEALKCPTWIRIHHQHLEHMLHDLINVPVALWARKALTTQWDQIEVRGGNNISTHIRILHWIWMKHPLASPSLISDFSSFYLAHVPIESFMSRLQEIRSEIEWKWNICNIMANRICVFTQHTVDCLVGAPNIIIMKKKKREKDIEIFACEYD